MKYFLKWSKTTQHERIQKTGKSRKIFLVGDMDVKRTLFTMVNTLNKYLIITYYSSSIHSRNNPWTVNKSG